MPAAQSKSSTSSPNGRIPVLPLRDTVHFPGQIHTLHVAREASRRAVREAINDGSPVLCLSQRDMSVEEPGLLDLYEVGVLSDVLQASPLPDGSLRVVLRANTRAERTRAQRKSGFLLAEYRLADRKSHAAKRMPAKLVAMMRLCVETFEQIINLSPTIPPESLAEIVHLDDPGVLADAIAHHLPLPPHAKQHVLEVYDEAERLELIKEELAREHEVLSLRKEIHEKVEAGLGASQRDLLLREQLRAIQVELGEDAFGTEHAQWTERIASSEMPLEPRSHAERELAKLERSHSNGPEASVIRTYLDTLTSMPWFVRTPESIDLMHAAELLNEEHTGMQGIKSRILEYLAVYALTQRPLGQALCFVGPPGVGKTSVARCIAKAMGRKFAHVSLGGLRDEAEIRGHRRTYVGAMPGRIIQSVRRTGVRNPVILLDEIDKVHRDDRSDATGALLEALDPSLNREFVDHYLEVPFDLSEVIFIATANSLHGLPIPLQDRLECVDFPGYTDSERLHIAQKHLWPRVLAECGLDGDAVKWTQEAWESLIADYSFESGLRQLERRLSQLGRRVAKTWVLEGRSQFVIDEQMLQDTLGVSQSRNLTLHQARIGQCFGLAVSEIGGAVLSIEAVDLPKAGTMPSVKLTGLLGQVMEESAETALTLVRRQLSKQGTSRIWDRDLHVHIGEGGVPKDGPSAGLALSLAIWSTAIGVPVPPGSAVMGEITLLGSVLPIGGIRDKLLAANRAKLRTVLIPTANRETVESLPSELTAKLDIRFVSSFEEAANSLGLTLV